jgi:hypothetical protein
MCDETNHGNIGQLTSHMEVSEYKIPRERQQDNCTLQKRGDGQTDTRNVGKTSVSTCQYASVSRKAFCEQTHSRELTL